MENNLAIFSDIFDLYRPGKSFRPQQLVNQTPCIRHLPREEQRRLIDAELKMLVNEHCEENPLLIKVSNYVYQVA